VRVIVRVAAASLGARAERISLDDPAWCEFVDRASGASASHLPAWGRLVSQTYGFSAFAFVLRDAGRVVAGVPLVDVTTRLRGRRYAALPFTDHCPLLGEPSVTPELVRALADLRVRDGLARIDVRDHLPEAHADVIPYPAGVRHRIALPRDPDVAFAAMSSGHRRDVRIAERAGLRAELGTSTRLVEAFVDLHTLTRKRLGIPVQPKRFLRAVGAALETDGLGYVTVVWHDQRPVAAGLFLFSHAQVLFKYSASDSAVWKLCPNNLLVWTAMRNAIERGATIFDFGRSEVEQTGLRAFKRRFGAEESPLVYTTIGGAPGSRRLEPGPVAQQVIRRAPSAVGELIGRALYRYVA
jgi:CelD/BcsL family acetyltransferase involved in cellulose biosynthesis